MAPEPAGKFHQWKGRLQAETTGYPFGNGPPFLDPVTGDPVFPVGANVVLEASLVTGLSVDFRATLGVAPYTFDFGDGTAPVVDPDGLVTHLFTADGNYDVVVTDAVGGRATAQASVRGTVVVIILKPFTARHFAMLVKKDGTAYGFRLSPVLGILTPGKVTSGQTVLSILSEPTKLSATFDQRPDSVGIQIGLGGEDHVLQWDGTAFSDTTPAAVQAYNYMRFLENKNADVIIGPVGF